MELPKQKAALPSIMLKEVVTGRGLIFSAHACAHAYKDEKAREFDCAHTAPVTI